MSPKIERPKAPYLQVADYLRARILDGDLRPGDSVPSERQLADEWDISRATATKALAALRSEGLVVSQPGRGTVVRTNGIVPRTPRERIRNLRRTGHFYSSGEHARILASGMREPTDDVRTALGLDEDGQAIARSRITYHESTPVEQSTTWFDGSIADRCPALLKRDRTHIGTTAYVEQQLKVRAAAARETVSAELATDDDLAKLELAGPTAVLITRLLVFTEDGTPLSYEEVRYPTDHRLRYEYDLPTEHDSAELHPSPSH